ncbi:MAG: sodium:solute symporter family protein, partial [Treponema sp.]|nr:sodium:solute symporter family protein [Treponema sp.]
MRLEILIPVLIYEVIVIFGVGFFIQKKNKAHVNEEGNFALGGRSMGVITLGITMALTVLGSAHVTGSLEMTYGMGAVAIWFSIAHVLLVVVACFGTGVWVKRLGVTTVPEALKGMFGGAVAGMIACVMAGLIWGILTLETQGLGIIINAMTGWSLISGCVIGGILGIFYVALAGMEEVGAVNVINAVVMYIGLVVAVLVIAVGLPGGNFNSIKAFYDGSLGFNGPENLSIFGTPALFINFAIVQVITVVFSQGINQQLMQCCISAKDEAIVKRAVWLAAPVNGLFGAFIITIGLTAKADPAYYAMGGKMFGMTYIVDHTPPILAIFVLAALLAAVLSTFAMTTLTPATIFAIDIYKRYFKPNATEKQVASIIRVMIVILGAFAVFISTFLPNILGAINWLFAWTVPVFWVFVTGLFWKRNKTVAMTSLIVTWIVNLFWTFVIQNPTLGIAGDSFFLNLANGYITLVVSLAIIIVGNIAVGDNADPPYFTIPEDRRKA